MINRNVRLFYTFTFLQSLGRGIWMGNVLSLYIVVLAESSSGVLGFSPNELLGMTSAATGLAMLAAVVPAGLLADRWSKRGMVLVGVFVGSIGLGWIALGSGLSSIVIGLFLWGLFQGLTRPPAEALLADSTPSGERSGVYARVHLFQQFGMASGPLLNVLLFAVLGDRWELAILRIVMLAGILFSFVSGLVMLGIREEHSLGSESDALETPRNHPRVRGARFIPHFFLASSFVIGFGAGMTVKFFPVFFRDIYGFQPIAVQIVMGLGFVATGLASLGAQRLSLKRGRGEMIVVLQAAAIACLVGMAMYPSAWLIILLFVTRGALMNASTPLSRSIVMDYVPKQRRGLWNSFQTVAWGLFWNASALVGGFLIGDDNYRLCFLITAGIYVLGTSIIVPMIPVIHREGAVAQKTAS
jgi:MFS family permease